MKHTFLELCSYALLVKTNALNNIGLVCDVRAHIVAHQMQFQEEMEYFTTE